MLANTANQVPTDCVSLSEAACRTGALWCYAIEKGAGFMFPAHLFFFPFLSFPLLMYFLPSIIALARGKRDLLAIFLLNFFLGWSVIGWFVALIWAAKHDYPVMVR